MSDSREQLRQRLAGGGEPPALLDRLEPPEADALLGLFEAASEQQRLGLEESMDAVLSHAPKLVRGRVQKVLFGKSAS